MSKLGEPGGPCTVSAGSWERGAHVLRHVAGESKAAPYGADAATDSTTVTQYVHSLSVPSLQRLKPVILRHV